MPSRPDDNRPDRRTAEERRFGARWRRAQRERRWDRPDDEPEDDDHTGLGRHKRRRPR